MDMYRAQLEELTPIQKAAYAKALRPKPQASTGFMELMGHSN